MAIETEHPTNTTPPSEDEKIHGHHVSTVEHVKDVNDALTRVDTHLDEQRINLGWRTWLVVFITMFANVTLVYVVVAAGSVIAFIIRDLGQPGLAGWIIQGPLVMQSVLSPIIGRLSDVLDRKWTVSIPFLFSFVGACISAKAKDMNVLIGGGILIGVGLSTLAILLAIPSEVLPLKYRTISGGSAFLGGAFGGLAGTLGAGGLTNQNIHGWRNIFWLQAAFHAVTFIGLVAFYHPQRRSDYPRMSIREYIWSMDPIGSLLFIASCTLILLGLDWTGGAYPWKSAHVLGPLCLGCGLLIIFGLYEWKGRPDGLIAHVFFRSGPNFPLSVFAFGVEGWIFYSAVNSIVPQVILNLGWETTAWHISTRQMSYQVVAIVACIPLVWYSTKYKDLKSPLVATFICFLVVTICYATVNPGDNKAQQGWNVIAAFGQAGPLTLIVPIVQFTSPHAYLSTATGLAFTARSVGGAFGSAVLDAIINSKLDSTLSKDVTSAATKAGLAASSVPDLLAAMAAGTGFDAIKGLNSTILDAAADASHWAHARAYRLAWASIVPFVVLAIVGILCLKGVKELMTEHVEASVEKGVTPEALPLPETKAATTTAAV